MSGRETIDISSTITASNGSRCPAPWRGARSGRAPSRRCSVVAAPTPGPTACSSSDSVSRAAALPVGAASAMRIGTPRASAWSASAATTREIVAVLPVPGPPQMTAVRARTAVRTAVRCASSRRSAAAGDAARLRSSRASSTSGNGPQRPSRAAVIDSSSCQ